MWLLVPRFYPAVLPSLVPLLLGGWFKLLFSCTFLWIWNKGPGKSWLFWQGVVPLFPLSISQIVLDAVKAAKTQDLQGSGMESSGMQILIVLTILKCVSRYYLIFCPFCPFFFPLASAVPGFPQALLLIFSFLKETSFCSLVPGCLLCLSWWFILDLFHQSPFSGLRNSCISLWLTNSIWQKHMWDFRGKWWFSACSIYKGLFIFRKLFHLHKRGHYAPIYL